MATQRIDTGGAHGQRFVPHRLAHVIEIRLDTGRISRLLHLARTRNLHRVGTRHVVRVTGQNVLQVLIIPGHIDRVQGLVENRPWGFIAVRRRTVVQLQTFWWPSRLIDGIRGDVNPSIGLHLFQVPNLAATCLLGSLLIRIDVLHGILGHSIRVLLVQLLVGSVGGSWDGHIGKLDTLRLVLLRAIHWQSTLHRIAAVQRHFFLRFPSARLFRLFCFTALVAHSAGQLDHHLGGVSINMVQLRNQAVTVFANNVLLLLVLVRAQLVRLQLFAKVTLGQQIGGHVANRAQHLIVRVVKVV